MFRSSDDFPSSSSSSSYPDGEYTTPPSSPPGGENTLSSHTPPPPQATQQECQCKACYKHDISLEPDATTSLFEKWCKLNERNPSKLSARYDFLRSCKLDVTRDDPPEYPGLCHATALISSGRRSFDQFSGGRREELQHCLDKVYADQYIGHFFDVGRVVENRWTVDKTLTDARGFFNQGVHMVSNHNQTVCIMKVLPSAAMYPGYAEREINILDRLRNHPNIVQIQDYHLPSGRHVAPWMVTDLCNAGTLDQCMDENIAFNVSPPELFIWHVYESLVEAVRYCHHGPKGKSLLKWDPISHRDIIPGNILLTYEETNGDDDDEIYPTVKLADFGCAMTESEVVAKDLRPNDMPEEDPSAIPPEGPMATEASDIYQVGRIILELLLNEATCTTHVKAREQYTAVILRLANRCVNPSRSLRPRSGVLLDEIKYNKTWLLDTKKIKYERLVSWV
jgi:hypothetical protein